MATALDLIEAALKEIGVLAESETAGAGSSADALTRLNRLIDRWAAEGLTIYAVTRTTATLTADQASFTVGSGGDIAITRPVFVDHVNFIDTSTDPDTEYPLPPLLTEAQWAGIRQKALTSKFPQAAYYSPTYPTGTLYPWPVPTSATLQWAIYHKAAVATFATLATTVSLPPGYEEALVTNLAVLLAPSYERTPSPVTIQAARESLATIKRANKRLHDLTFESAALIGHEKRAAWSIYTDS